MLLKPFMAVKIQHVGPLRLRHSDSLEVLRNVITGPGYVSGKNLTQLIHPLFSLRFIGADQRVHGENIHMIVAGKPRLLLDTVTQILAVNNMVRTDQSCQIEGFGRRVGCNDTVSCILRNALRRNMPMSLQYQIRPDFIGEDNAVVLSEHLHCLFNFFSFPHTSAGVVR